MRRVSKIEVTIQPGIDDLPLALIQLVEKRVDSAMVAFDYTRTISGKLGDKVFFTYQKHEPA